MKRQSISFILLLLITLFICCGCQSSKGSAAQDTASSPSEADTQVPEEAEERSALEKSATKEAAETQTADSAEKVEDAIGIFEGLEDNHTAIFSFDGAETAFYFEEPTVQDILFDAIIGSPYTLSYDFDSSLGLNVIYKISE